ETVDRRRVDEMRARQENGLARRTEVLLLESARQKTLASIVVAKTDVTLRRTVLAQLVGAEFGVPLAAPAGAAAPMPERADAIAQAVRGRPDLRVAAKAAEAAESSVDVARSGYWPTLAFVGNEYVARSGYSRSSKATDWDAEIDAS